jgi:hypothetical protein
VRHRRLFFLIVLPVVLAGVAVLAQSPGQLPLEPIRDSGQSITGAFEGWYQNPDGSYSVLVGYFNRNSKQAIDIPVGPNNKIEPGDPDRGQPTHFLPRRQWGVFAIRVPKDFGTQKLTWTITANGQTTTIPLHLNPLWVVEPLKDAALGNTPPTIKFAADGKSFQGPPGGFAATYSATVSEPLALDVWVTDDGVLPPERSANTGREGVRASATSSWSKYRGPGTVTFENARPIVNATDGKASTTAKFDLPGEYVLRLQANDSSGEGGGGFQCCWTNAHVKVTVTGTPTSK